MARLGTFGAETGHDQAEGLANVGSGMSYATDRVRTGTRSFKCTAAATSSYKNFAITGSTGRWYYGRWYINVDSIASLGASGLEIGGIESTAATFWYAVPCLFSDGKIDILNGNNGGSNVLPGTTTNLGSLSDDTWYCIELGVFIAAAAGSDDRVILKIDGVQVYDSGLFNFSTVAPNSFHWGHNQATASGSDAWWDDVALNDDQGSDQNTWCGRGKVYFLLPASDPGTSSANWTKPGGATTNRHTSVDNVPPVFETYDSTSASAEDYQRNAVSGANAALNITLQSYTAAGIGANDQIKVLLPVAVTGSSSATDTAGDIGISSNPTIAQAAFTAFDNGVASSTATTWPRQVGTVTYNPSVTKGTGPVMQIRKGTATTRVAIVTLMGMYVDVLPEQASAIGIASETDAAQAIGKNKAKLLGIASETDAALTITAVKSGGSHLIAVGIASETDTALGVGKRKAKVLGIAAEVNAAVAITRAKLRAVTSAIETDVALSLGRLKSKALGIASEADTAVAILKLKRKLITLASETDTAQPLARSKQRAITLAPETDSALTISNNPKRRLVGISPETDVAMAIVPVTGTAPPTTTRLPMTGVGQ